ncbi:MAG: hypothetical protein A2X49_06340 [Lentisphaerae bacterium GWF2_52_8]|nr:MAG: hypothetical protein A2X49_06340 [Lentisphaerae bacterium GWF2_52_8]
MPQEIAKIIEAHSGEIKTVSDNIHAHPELGMKEYQAAAWLTSLLKQWGFKVIAPCAGVETAFRAEYGSGKPVFCFMAEYDALEMGHACGHNLIAASALAAAIATKTMMEREKIPGKLVLLGTPGEEGHGGKLLLIKGGAFADIEAALISHPSEQTMPDPGCLSTARYTVSFKGEAAHAAIAPDWGRNALDAVMLLFAGINAWRQQLPEAARVHGIVKDGGTAPNIIPETASAFFYIRADTETLQAKLEERFKKIVEGAALMSDTSCEIQRLDSYYQSSIYNAPLNEMYVKSAAELGLDPKPANVRAGRGSTDFGNVSQILPSANLHFSIAKKPLQLHTIELRDAAGSEYGFKQAMKAGAAMATIGLRYMKDPEYRNAVQHGRH